MTLLAPTLATTILATMGAAIDTLVRPSPPPLTANFMLDAIAHSLFILSAATGPIKVSRTQQRNQSIALLPLLNLLGSDRVIGFRPRGPDRQGYRYGLTLDRAQTTASG